MTTVNVLSIMATALVGMLGWYFAWRARGEASEERRRAESALAGEMAASAMTLEASQGKLTAQAQAAAERSRADSLSVQLDTERVSRQALIDALKKAGVAVGPVVVESALDRLYPDPDGGGQGSGAGSGGDQAGVSGQSSQTPRAPQDG